MEVELGELIDLVIDGRSRNFRSPIIGGRWISQINLSGVSIVCYLEQFPREWSIVIVISQEHRSVNFGLVLNGTDILKVDGRLSLSSTGWEIDFPLFPIGITPMSPGLNQRFQCQE